MKFKLIRDMLGRTFTLGKLYVDNVYLCETCEDSDRKLEDGGIKIQDQTAIPRGEYKLTTSHSHRFGKVLPELLDVPQFSGVRIHGGNGADDTSGCILVGKIRTSNGIANCAPMVQRIIDMIDSAEEIGEVVTVEIR